MKLILTGFSLILLMSVSSCTKTDNITTTTHDSTTVVVRDTLYKTLKNPIVGLWIGSWKSTTDQADSTYYSFDIAGNGRMTTTSIAWAGNSDAATGPWQLSGTSFTATVTQLDGNSTLYVQALAGVYDSVAGTLTGTSTFTQGPGSDQTFLLLRVPN